MQHPAYGVGAAAQHEVVPVAEASRVATASTLRAVRSIAVDVGEVDDDVAVVGAEELVDRGADLPRAAHVEVAAAGPGWVRPA